MNCAVKAEQSRSYADRAGYGPFGVGNQPFCKPKMKFQPLYSAVDTLKFQKNAPTPGDAGMLAFQHCGQYACSCAEAKEDSQPMPGCVSGGAAGLGPPEHKWAR